MTVTLETLGAIYRIAKYFIYADGDLTEDEVKPVFDWFQTFPDITKEKLDYIMDLGEHKLTDARAIELIAGLDADGKQQMANLFAHIICADGQLTDEEKALWFRVRDLCELPDPQSDDEPEEEPEQESFSQAPAPAPGHAAQEESDEEDEIDPTFIIVNFYGQVSFKQSVHEDWSTLGGEIEQWLNADGLEVVRYTPALNAITEKLSLNERHLVFLIDRHSGQKTVGDNMPATILLGRGYPLYGNIAFALETDKGYEIEGFLTRSLVLEVLDEVNAAVDGLLRFEE
ncbi:MAG: TerB family tellurite resistance protein [Bacteroidales bacterium]|nr:TerB family tellurite resistance protein [Bacteroidales bacterium]